MKTQIILILLAALSLKAQDFKREPPQRPRLTDEQRACLEKILGKPGEGERPSREKHEAAMKSCGIERPARPEGPPPERLEQNSSSGQDSGGAVQ